MFHKFHQHVEAVAGRTLLSLKPVCQEHDRGHARLSDCTEGWGWRTGELGVLGRGGGLSGGVRCWLRSLKTALKALCFQLKHPSRITHTKTYLQPAKSGACYLQRAYKSHLAASGYGISLPHTYLHTHTHTHSSIISNSFFSSTSFPLCHCPPLVMCQIRTE